MIEQDKKKVTCFICGHRTLEDRCDWEICPVCFWEDDVYVTTEDTSSPANGGMLVSEAQANFIRYGAMSPGVMKNVRAPELDEQKDPDWKPLPKTLEILKSV